MTVAEFLEWDPDSGRRWQLIDGEPVAMAPAGHNHGVIQTELAYLLTAHLIASASMCHAVTAPGIIPRVRATENFRIPDLGVTCTPSTGSVEVPNTVLLVEILSPSNYRQTRANVWSYATLPSVREILVVHSTRIEAELLRRLPDLSWPAQPTVLRDGEALALETIGLTLPVRAMYRTTSLLG